MFCNQTPQAFEKAESAFHARVVPLQRLLRGCREHHEQAHCVGTVFLDHFLRVHGVALGLGHLGAVFEHHALTQQLLEGLVGFHQAGVAQQFVEEARIEQVQDGVFNAAHILVHGQPVVGGCRVQHGLVVLRAAVTGVVPAGLHEGVEGVGFAQGGLTVKGGLGPLRVGLDGAFHAVHLYLGGQHHRQLVFLCGVQFTVFGFHHGNGGAPVTLPGDTPVAQAIIHFFLAQVALAQPGGDGVEGLGGGLAGEFPGVHQFAFFGEGFAVQIDGLTLGRFNHLLDGQAVFFGKFVIPLVVGGHGHDGTGAVAHQHEVGYPDRDLFAADRVSRGEAGVDAFLFHGGHIGFGHLVVQALFHKVCHFMVGSRGFLCQRVRCRHGHIAHPHQGVRAGGVDAQRRFALNGEFHFHAFRAADPVALHGLDLFRPAIQLVQVF